MNWAEIGTQVILSLFGVLLSGIGVIITYLINKYIKDDKAKTHLLNLNNIVTACVQDVYQTYVEALKKDGLFDKEAQEYALQLCLDKINSQLPNDLKTWINSIQVDLDVYLKTLIESSVYSLKTRGVK